MKVIDNATVSVEAGFTETTKNNDTLGTPATDLAYTSVYYRVGTGPVIVGAKVVASKPTGGGNQMTTIIVPAPVGAVTQLNFQASSTDLAGNEGPLTSVVTIDIERLAPAPPISFTVA
jgi:hypothetical protein